MAEHRADEGGRVPVDAGDRREPPELDHLAEEVVGDHAVREREHQEVDPQAAGRDGPEEHADPDRDRDRDEEDDRWVPAESQTLGLPAHSAMRDEVADHVAGDPHERGLGERDHAAWTPCATPPRPGCSRWSGGCPRTGSPGPTATRCSSWMSWPVSA